MAEISNKLEHLDWAVKSRSRNQQCCLELFKLFDRHAERWRTKKYSRAAQELVAIAFSLWRAAFLADKSGKRGEVFAHGRNFLGKIIEDNAISYPQDKLSREWTFNYYTRNARYSLEFLAGYWPEQVEKYTGDTRNAVQRWDYCQDILEGAVSRFGKLLDGLTEEKKQAKAEGDRKRIIRQGARQRRSKVRELTLAERKAKSGA